MQPSISGDGTALSASSTKDAITPATAADNLLVHEQTWSETKMGMTDELLNFVRNGIKQEGPVLYRRLPDTFPAKSIRSPQLVFGARHDPPCSLLLTPWTRTRSS